jgi:hypothetical protein
VLIGLVVAQRHAHGDGGGLCVVFHRDSVDCAFRELQRAVRAGDPVIDADLEFHRSVCKLTPAALGAGRSAQRRAAAGRSAQRRAAAELSSMMVCARGAG